MSAIITIINKRISLYHHNLFNQIKETISLSPYNNYGSYYSLKSKTDLFWVSDNESSISTQPITNENKNLKMFFSGEIIRDPDVETDLLSKGHNFSKGKIDYLIHLYEDRGDDFWKLIDGYFVCIIIDEYLGKTIICNDRFSMKRLFKYETPDFVIFSTQAKSIVGNIPDSQSFDISGLTEFITSGCTIGKKSLYSKIEIVDSASLIEYQNGALNRIKYYFHRSEFESLPKLKKEYFISDFKTQFLKTVVNNQNSCGNTALSLTGGLDSRMILGALISQKEQITCYTFQSKNKESYDAKIAREISKKFHLEFSSLTMDQEFEDSLIEYFEKAVLLSDGYIGLSGAAELYVNNKARNIAPVRITGNYGSELLRGVRSFKSVIPDFSMFNNSFKKELPAAVNRFYNNKYSDNSLSYVLFYQVPNQGFGRMSIEDSQLILRSPFLNNKLLKLLYQAPEDCDKYNLGKQLIALGSKELLSIPTDRGYLGKGGKYTKLTRHNFRQFLFKSEYAIGPGAPDFVIRNSWLINLLQLEKILTGNHKFYNYRLWIRDLLKDYIYNMLLNNSDFMQLSFIDNKKVSTCLADHFNGKKNYSIELNKMLIIAVIQKYLFKGQKS